MVNNVWWLEGLPSHLRAALAFPVAGGDILLSLQLLAAARSTGLHYLMHGPT